MSNRDFTCSIYDPSLSACLSSFPYNVLCRSVMEVCDGLTCLDLILNQIEVIFLSLLWYVFCAI